MFLGPFLRWDVFFFTSTHWDFTTGDNLATNLTLAEGELAFKVDYRRWSLECVPTRAVDFMGHRWT